MQRETAYDMVFDAQEHYRLLLDAMARPGSIRVLPRMPLAAPPPLNPAAALVGFALLNADVTFYVDGPDAPAARLYLIVNTASGPVSIDKADFVFAAGTASADLPEVIKKGSLTYPEEGATLVAGVEALATEAAGLGDTPDMLRSAEETDRLMLTLQGPGIRGEQKLFVRGLNVALLDALQQCNKEFPLGIDLMLTDPDGRLACIPRSSRVRREIL